MEQLTARIRSQAASQGAPVFVGIDGRSGAGKSTLAAATAARLPNEPSPLSVLVIEGDQFYAGGSDNAWDSRSATEKADRVIDWRRQADTLDALRTTGVATWHPFDWDAPDWDAEVAPLQERPVNATAADVVILEGAYSCRPELHGLLDLRVLLDTPDEERRRRLLRREGDAYRDAWEQRWSEAEDHYFGVVMPSERFDLVL